MTAVRRFGLDTSLAATLATLAVPAVDGVAAVTGASRGGSVPVIAGTAFATFVICLLGIRSVSELPERVDGWPALVVVGAPVATFAWFLLAVVRTDAFDPVLAVGSLAIVPGGMAIALAHSIALERRVAGTEELLTFEARPGARIRAIATGAVGVLVCSVLVVWGVALVTDDPFAPVDTFVPMVGGLSAAVTAVHAEREVTVTDEGILVSGAFVEYDDVESFAVAGTTLVVRRSGWRRRYTFDLDDVEDPAVLRSTLAEHVPERSDSDDGWM